MKRFIAVVAIALIGVALCAATYTPQCDGRGKPQPSQDVPQELIHPIAPSQEPDQRMHLQIKTLTDVLQDFELRITKLENWRLETDELLKQLTPNPYKREFTEAPPAAPPVATASPPAAAPSMPQPGASVSRSSTVVRSGPVRRGPILRRARARAQYQYSSGGSCYMDPESGQWICPNQ